MTLTTRILVFVSLLALSVIVYFPSFHAPFQLDDYPVLVKNFITQDIDNVFNGKLWFFDPSRFIVHLSFSINQYFSGLDVFGFHVVNFIVHLLSGVFVYNIAKYFLKNKNQSKLIAVFSASIFLFHPIQTSAVTYIVQRATLLAAFFYLGAFYFYVLYREKDKILFYFISLLSALFGIFCKPILLSLPFVLLLYEMIERKGARDVELKNLKSVFPFFIIVLLLPILLILMKYKSFDLTQLINITHETDTISRKDYFLTQINVIRTYVRMLFFPVFQNLDYDYPITKSFFNISTISSFGFLSLVFFIGIRFFKRNKIISFAIFWFFIALSVESSVFPISDVIFEHRLYLPMVGFSLLLPAVIFSVIKNKRIAYGILMGILIVYAILSFQRNQLWSNRILFLEDMVKKSPNKARVHENLAFAYFENGNYEKAIQYYSSAIDLKPDYTASLLQRGLCYSAIKKSKLALADYDKLLLIDPQHVLAHNNRGTVYHALHEYDLALKSYDRAIELDPAYAVAYYNRGVVYALQGKNDLAIEDFNKTLKLNPNYIKAYHSRGIEYGNKKQYGLAIDDFDYVIHSNFKNGKVYFNRAITFQKMGNEKAAQADFREASKRGYNVGQSN